MQIHINSGAKCSFVSVKESNAAVMAAAETLSHNFSPLSSPTGTSRKLDERLKLSSLTPTGAP